MMLSTIALTTFLYALVPWTNRLRKCSQTIKTLAYLVSLTVSVLSVMVIMDTNTDEIETISIIPLTIFCSIRCLILTSSAIRKVMVEFR